MIRFLCEQKRDREKRAGHGIAIHSMLSSPKRIIKLIDVSIVSSHAHSKAKVILRLFCLKNMNLLSRQNHFPSNYLHD